jgi:predicted dehydrogenase
MRKIRLGVVGTGLVFRHCHWPVLREVTDRFDVVALCNRTAAKAEAMAAEMGTSPSLYADYGKLLARDDVEAVLVAVPIALTAEVVHAALSQDKHVFQEKPIAVRVSEGKSAIKLAGEHRVVLFVGENFRYRPEFGQVYRLVQEGAIGRPLLYRLNDLHYRYPDGLWSQALWRQQGEHDGGYLIDGGVHIVAGMCEMVRSRVKLVHGLTASFDPDLSGGQDDTLLLHLVFNNGMVGQVALGYATVDHDARRPKVYGDRGTLVLDPARKRIELWPVGKEAETQTFSTETADDFRAEWLDFYSAVAEGKPLHGTSEDALMDLRIIDAGRRSAVTGQTVTLDT